jgi:hypothetical protein
MTWTIKHKRTGEVIATYNTIDECITHIRGAGLRVWATIRDKQLVYVVEDERKVQSCT